MNEDSITRFMFDPGWVRGEIVRLDQSYQQIMQQHQYPKALQHLLGECLAAAVLMTHTIKFEGQLTLQFQGEGALKMLVAKCDHHNHIRGYASWQPEADASMIASALQSGQLVVTIAPDHHAKPYQSIIALTGQTISGALETYFAQSEQLPTLFFCTTDSSQVAGLLLQKMPSDQEDEQAAAFWEHVVTLARTLTPEELLTLDNKTVLHRLFHQEQVRLFTPEAVAFECRCSRDRMADTVRMLGFAECEQILANHHYVEVVCEYCNQRCCFDRQDIERLFQTH